MVRERYSELRPGELTEHAVGWPGFRNREGGPVRCGGGKLAPDLSLPRLQAHWSAKRAVDTSASRVSLRVRLRMRSKPLPRPARPCRSFSSGFGPRMS